MRLIRLIRIIKLYKYFLKTRDAKQKEDEDGNPMPKKKKKVEPAQSEAALAGLPNDEPESLFRKETDPSKLGKALSDTNTREVIIAVLLMLMVLPLLAPSTIDFSQEYGIRELFWLGRSNCEIPTKSTLTGAPLAPSEINTFLCEESAEKWITEEGWYELLRQFVSAADLANIVEPSWTVLWIYVPDFTNKGQMNTIINVPKAGNVFKVNDPDPFWEQEDACAGPYVSDDC